MGFAYKTAFPGKAAPHPNTFRCGKRDTGPVSHFPQRLFIQYYLISFYVWLHTVTSLNKLREIREFIALGLRIIGYESKPQSSVRKGLQAVLQKQLPAPGPVALMDSHSAIPPLPGRQIL